MSRLDAQSAGGTNGSLSRQALRPSQRPLEQARHVPGFVYTSPEVFALEKQRLFMKDWICIARVEELENPGDYLTHIVMGEPLMVTRDEQHELHAFYNLCAHRGVEVAQGVGNAKRFKCPYHAWTYDLAGKLLGAPFMKKTADFDPDRCGLKPLRLGTWAGWIFVSFNPDVEPLETFVEFFEAEYGMLRQQDCRLAFKYVTEFDCNWKFCYENLMDIYHVGTLHAKTIGRHQRQGDDSHKFHVAPRGRLSIHYEALTMSPDGESRVGKMPWMANQPESFARVGFMPPNMNVLARCDYVRPFLHWPLAPNKTRSVAYFLFPKEKFDEPGFDDNVKVYVDYLANVLDEDRTMVQSLQRAMNTDGFKPGPMSFLEKAIHHVIGHHLDRVFDGGVT
jgi:phenylpropionate dioxygenase-like ring-hydroxylating dioxygenase large terminal subunit